MWMDISSPVPVRKYQKQQGALPTTYLAACPAAAAWRPAPTLTKNLLLWDRQLSGQTNKAQRLEALGGKGGIGDCGNSQNCIEICPKGLPLRRAIGEMNREVFGYKVKKWLKAD